MSVSPRSVSAFCGALLLLAVSLCALPSPAQDQSPFGITISTNAQKTRIAAANVRPGASGDLVNAFNTTLQNDLQNSGVFDVVSKSMEPETTPGAPNEVNLAQWSAAPASAAFLAFGSLDASGSQLVLHGYLDDTHNQQFPQVFAQSYNDSADVNGARQIAHKFADEIIFRLGGGIQGIAETKIYYVHFTGNGNKEIWVMDYDGQNQHAITHLGEISLSPRVSPDNSRIAFSELTRDGFQIKMFSLLLGRLVTFNSVGGMNISPAWSPDGQHLAFSSARSGHPEIWVSDPQGEVAHQITNTSRPNEVSPTWNPKTGAQIAWISGRTGLPQLYIMDADGSGIQRMTDGGYATSPSWSPNGQFLAFAWNRKYGPGAPGGQDIYVMDIASKRWIQLTHDIGRCDFPSWSPDGRHIVFANTPGASDRSTRIMTMLADGTDIHTLTRAGSDMPNWSFR